MSSYNIPYTRYVKQGSSDLLSCTAIATMLSQAYQRMIVASWRRVESVASDLPPHNFLQTGFKDTFDASAYCGDYADGRQRAYATAACYTVKIPDDALAGTVATIESVSLAAAGDRWLSGGCVVAAILSTTPTPPIWADIIGTPISTPDPVVVADENDPTWQAPFRQITRSNSGADSRSFISLPVDTTAQQYLHIIIRLGDYANASYLAWVEGGAIIDGGTISIKFDRAVSSDTVPTAVRLAVQQTGTSKRVTFAASNYNLATGYLQLHWGARMLLSGFVDPSTAVSENTANLDQDKHLAPCVTISGGVSTAHGEYAEAYCAEPLLAGNTLWIRAAESTMGAAPVRVTVIASDNAPDVTNGAMWDGTEDTVIGTALTSPQAGEWVGVPITKNASTRKLQIVACIAAIPAADAESTSVGFPNIGFDLCDLHVASSPAIPSMAVLPDTGILVVRPDALASGDIFHHINSGLPVTDPISDKGKVGLTSTASACLFGTSYGAWQNLDGSPAAPFSGTYSHLAIWSGEGFFLALDSYTRKWYKAGILPVALATLTETATSASLDRIVVDGGTVAWVDDFAMQGIKTAGESSSWKTTVETWTDALLISKAGNVTIAICTDGESSTITRAHIHNDNVGAKDEFETVTGAIDVAIAYRGNTHYVIFRMLDGSVKAFTWIAFQAPSEVTLEWTNVTDIGIADGKFWAISDNTLLCSSSKPVWADDSLIPATSTRKILLSGGERLGIAYS